MIKIDVRHNLGAVAATVARDAKQVRFAAARALSATARSVRGRERIQMGRLFSNPVPYTLNALYTRNATASNLTAEVWLKGEYGEPGRSVVSYLGPQIFGGVRNAKPFERALAEVGILRPGWVAVPGAGAQIDRYGNMRASQIRQILSYFKAAERTLGYSANTTDATRARLKRGTRAKRGFEYFVSQPARGSGARTSHLLPGIYQRTQFGFGTAIKPVLIFVPRASYRKLLPYFEIAQSVVDREFGPHYEAAMRDIVGGRYGVIVKR